MYPKFVICIDNDWCDLVEGKVYQAFPLDGPDIIDYIRIMDETGVMFRANRTRFKAYNNKLLEILMG